MNVSITTVKAKSDSLIHRKFNPTAIEKKWQEVWEKEKVYQPSLETAKNPFYNLMMFPYPSAEGLHVGNMYAFTGADIYGRFKRMQGFSVFEPIGLDGFGIHSENYAITVGRHPRQQAKLSEQNFYRQLQSIGNGFDWSRTVETYDPDYYKWTQWIFIQLFKAGLAYRRKSPVNFCPKDLTVLADEQVIEGRCERCGSAVEKRDLEQWFFKITAYADRLLSGLNQIDWTEKVKIAQRNWIGKKEGTLIKFKVVDSESVIDVFTTRGDTLYGATFIVLAPEHPIVSTTQDKRVQEYIKKVKAKPESQRAAGDKEKTGVFTGLYAINPVNQEKLPVWIADYALMGYGTGALFGDAHDERDVVFAKRYGIPLKPTLKTGDKERDARIVSLDEVFTGDGVLFDSGEFSGMLSKEAREKVRVWLEKHNTGGTITTYHLRDWLISRQRYWGSPIPMVYCQSCADKGKSWFTIQKTQAIGKLSTEDGRQITDTSEDRVDLSSVLRNPSSVIRPPSSEMAGWYPEENLPVLLPDVKDWKPKGTGKSPLASVESFVHATCPNCGKEAVRETDVSDTFLDSSWYFFRYISTESEDSAWDKNRAKKWLPVSMYIGGAEHSVLHLLYTRFLTMVFHDLKLVDFDEPFPKFYAHGLLIKEGAKMSKSRGNVVVPDEYIKKYGVDTLRTYLMFLGPFSQGGDFYDSSIGGVYRFLQRVYRFVQAQIEQFDKLTANKNIASESEKNKIIEAKIHETIKKVTEDMEGLRFNTAIAALMELLNTFHDNQNSIKDIYLEQFLLMLAPFAPHLAEELWQEHRTLEVRSGKWDFESLNSRNQNIKKSSSKRSHFVPQENQFVSIHTHPWPVYDPKLLERDEVTIVVSVDGKMRDIIRCQKLEVRSRKYVEKKAKESEKIKKHLEGKTVKKVVYVEGKLINFVTED